MKIMTKHWIGIVIGLFIIISDLVFLMGEKSFYFILGIGVLIAVFPFIASVIIKAGREKEKEEMFLEFARDLVGSVKAGTPISKSIIQMRNKNFGSLTPHVTKLANQISMGISVRNSLTTFAKDVNNRVISKSISLIIEAEESGGQIDLILESTAKSIGEIEDIKKEQKSAMYNFVIQGYIIFAIFLVIMLIVQLKFIPSMMKTISQAGLGGGEMPFGFSASSKFSIDVLNNLFLALILVQGLFNGLVIGKLAEGRISGGIKHSLILVAAAYLITTGVKIFV
mgnify:CR=1 FL=1